MTDNKLLSMVELLDTLLVESGAEQVSISRVFVSSYGEISVRLFKDGESVGFGLTDAFMTDSNVPVLDLFYRQVKAATTEWRQHE